jgi:SAM-dependent methyltransferase
MTDRTTDVALQVRGLFDAKAAAWPSKYAPGGRLANRLTRLADAVAYNVPAGGSVLDLGCGTGELARALATSGMRATGCDISPEMLQRAVSASPAETVDWVRLDLGWRELPFEPRTFDAVVASSVLEYVDDPVAVLRECRRVLRPHGVVLFTVPDPRHPVRWAEWLLRVAGRVPAVRAASRRGARLNSYLTYLRISRHRHSSRWWRAAALRADLITARAMADPELPSPLRLLTFRRPDDRKSYE